MTGIRTWLRGRFRPGARSAPPGGPNAVGAAFLEADRRRREGLTEEAIAAYAEVGEGAAGNRVGRHDRLERRLELRQGRLRLSLGLALGLLPVLVALGVWRLWEGYSTRTGADPDVRDLALVRWLARQQAMEIL